MKARTTRRSAFAGGVALVVGSTSLAGLPPTQTAQAQQSTASVSYNIPAGSLSTALTRWARASNMKLLASAEALRGRTTPGLSGSHAPHQALSALLAGTGLAYTFNGSTVTINDPSASGSAGDATIPGAIALDTIDVSGGGSAAAADLPYQTPGSSAYISQETIERFRGTSPGDMFKSTPGVLTGEARNGGAIDVNIRGLQGFGRVAVTVDGSQQASHSSRGYQGAAGRTYIDPDLIGGISIDKGPTLDPSGSGAIGGVVAMRTIEAGDVLLPGQNFGVRLRAGANTNSSHPPLTGTRGGVSTTTSATSPNISLTPGELPPPAPTKPTVAIASSTANGMDRPDLFDLTGGNGSVAVAGRSENFEFVAALALRQDGNYHAGENGPAAERVYVNSQITSYSPTQNRYRIRDNYQLTGISLYRAGEEVLNTSQDNMSALVKGKGRFGDGHEIELGYMRYESDFGATWPSNLQRFNQVYQTELSHVEVDTYTARYKWKPSDNRLIDVRANLWRTEQFEDLEAGTLSILIPSLSRTEQWGSDVSNTSRFDFAFGGFALRYGASYLNEKATPLNPLVYANRDGNRDEASLFTSLEWTPASWLTFDTGLRYSYFQAHNNLATDPSTADSSNDGLAPSFGVTVTPFSGIQLFARYVEGYRMPSLYEGQGGSVPVSYGLPWFDLRPEHAKNHEFGLNVLRNNVLADGDKARLKIAYFDNTVDDYISRIVTTVPNPPIPGYTVAVPKNIDRAHFSGIEVSGDYDNGRLFAQAGLTVYDDVEFCVSGVCTGGSGSGADFAQNHVPPKFSASLTFGTRWFDEKLTLGSRIMYVGERAGEVLSSNWTEAIVWEPYTLVDVFASYKVSEQMSFHLIGENITDRFYVDPLSLAGIPGPGRTLRASLMMKY